MGATPEALRHPTMKSTNLKTKTNKTKHEQVNDPIVNISSKAKATIQTSRHNNL